MIGDLTIRVTWDEIKEFLDAGEAECVYIEGTNRYFIKATDDNFCLQCVVDKTDPENLEQEDFEDNYKPSANKKTLKSHTLIHSTPRPLGTYTYFSGADDDHTDPTLVGGDNESNIQDLVFHHEIEGDNPEVLYLDFNCITNETWLREGYAQWKDIRP